MTTMPPWFDTSVAERSRRWPRLAVTGVLSALIGPLVLGLVCFAAIESERIEWRTGIILFAVATSLFFSILAGASVMSLRARELRYRTIVETASDGIFIADSQGRFRFVNDRFAEMLARTPEELIGRDGREFVSAEDRPSVDDTFRSRRFGLIRSHREIRFTRPNGDERSVIATTTTTRAASGRFSGVVGTITDITARVAAEDKLRALYEANEAAHRTLERAHEALRARVNAADNATLEDLAERLAAANHELETFTYSVSHDLRAPLRAMSGFCRELQLGYKDVLDERGLRYLDRINRATDRMGTLIDDLLLFSRTSRDTLQRRDVDVSTLARDVAADLLERNRERAIEIDVEDGIRTQADGRLLRIVLDNLLGNAVKFTAPRDVARIAVRSVQRDGVATITIQDNGVGFDPAYASKLFMPFHRLHRASEFEGNGIGLAIVHRIVHRHGGNTWAESMPGEGATFAFSLGAA
jgi:PAS domain S-box-containing protein